MLYVWHKNVKHKQTIISLCFFPSNEPEKKQDPHELENAKSVRAEL